MPILPIFFEAMLADEYLPPDDDLARLPIELLALKLLQSWLKKRVQQARY